MRRLRVLLVLLVAGTVFSVAQEAMAQQAHGLYGPYGRAYRNPWWGLFRRNTGPFDNYHNYVQPEIRMRDFQRQQQTTIHQQSAQIQSLQQETSRLRRLSLPPTGVSAGWMTHYGYFQTQGRYYGAR